jgi:hypothetical protein
MKRRKKRKLKIKQYINRRKVQRKRIHKEGGKEGK